MLDKCHQPSLPHRLGRHTGNQMIREFGQAGFPTDENFDYFMFEGGVIAIKCYPLGGTEVHVAMQDPKPFLVNFAYFMDLFGGPFWAFIDSSKSSLLRSAKRLGFEFIDSYEGVNIDGDSVIVNQLRRP